MVLETPHLSTNQLPHLMQCETLGFPWKTRYVRILNSVRSMTKLQQGRGIAKKLYKAAKAAGARHGGNDPESGVQKRMDGELRKRLKKVDWQDIRLNKYWVLKV
jgi:hypothetical protein